MEEKVGNDMRKKGFTLIELLAVIVILAIIALIATPMILGVIDSARKGAVESSTYGYIESFNNSSLKNMIDTGNVVTKPDGIYDETTIGQVDTKGTLPDKVCLTVLNGEIISGKLQFNDYVVKYENKKASVVDEEMGSCDTSLVPVNYQVGDHVFIQLNSSTKLSFYVLADHGDTITALMDQNLGADVAWNINNTNNEMTNLKSALMDRTNGWTNTELVNDQFDTTTYTNARARVITASEVGTVLGQTFDGAESFYSIPEDHWLLSHISDNASVNGYWTSTPRSTNNYQVYIVGDSMFGMGMNASDANNGGSIFMYTGVGLRPVVTVKKNFVTKVSK